MDTGDMLSTSDLVTMATSYRLFTDDVFIPRPHPSSPLPNPLHHITIRVYMYE